MAVESKLKTLPSFAPGGLPALDGVRGLLAVWVFLSHVTQFVDGPRGLIDRGGIAVDLFMMVSGFLMYWTIATRSSVEPPDALPTWGKFFVRRFFRIAPLYFLALLVAMSFGDFWKGELQQIYVGQGRPFDRPFESCERSLPADVFLHLTFVYGFFPCYAASNVLPDWSLSLEMQFYAAFPLLFLLLRRFGSLPMAVGAALLTGVSAVVVGVYLIDPTKWISYPQPTLLALRLNCFVVGMLLARALFKNEFKGWDVVALLLAIVLFQRATFAVIAFGLILVFLAEVRENTFWSARLLGPFGRVKEVLGFRVFRWLGDISFGVYLLHLFVLIPLVKTLLAHSWFIGLGGLARFGIVVVLAFGVVSLFATAAHRYVEKPCIDLARRLVSKRARV